jgi:CheY-like chemotaxis protein
MLANVASTNTPDGIWHDHTTGAGTVLVVDDEALILSTIKRLLSRNGLQVTLEQRPARAVERLKAGERFDAILCDMVMPELAGAEFYRQVLLVAPEQCRRTVFMTGNAFLPETTRFFASVTNMWIDKPFQPDKLRRVVDDVIKQA